MFFNRNICEQSLLLCSVTESEKQEIGDLIRIDNSCIFLLNSFLMFLVKFTMIIQNLSWFVSRMFTSYDGPYDRKSGYTYTVVWAYCYSVINSRQFLKFVFGRVEF